MPEKFNCYICTILAAVFKNNYLKHFYYDPDITNGHVFELSG